MTENIQSLNQEPARAPAPPKKESALSEIIRFILISLAIVIPIRMYGAEPFIVSGSSMFPTFDTGHYLIIDQVSYRFENPDRGDIVVFHYPKDPEKFFIKRVVGLPGETIQIKDGRVLVINADFPDGLLLDEPYIEETRNENMVVALTEDEYFVMGDNRIASSDSRIWGPLPRENIVGKVFLRLFPIGDLDILPGQFHQ
jgi:signal peptidase I